MFRTATIIALAGLVSAQWVPDLHLFESQESQFFTRLQLSNSCLSALTGIVANQDANSCLSPTTLLPLVTDNSSSIVGPITNWTQNICSAAPCSNNTLASVVSSLTSGCQADIAGNDASVDPSTLASTITPYVQRYYPTVRSIVCLQEWAQFHKSVIATSDGEFQQWHQLFSFNLERHSERERPSHSQQPHPARDPRQCPKHSFQRHLLGLH